MKKILYTVTVIALLSTGSIFTSCQSSAQKEQAAEDKVQDAQQELDAAKMNANIVEQKAATAEQFKTFKLESELKIKNNEVSIVELKLKMKQSGTALDEVYANRIDTLELKNQKLKSRINSYEKTHTDWETFRLEFNRDMDELGKALKDLTVKNKK